MEPLYSVITVVKNDAEGFRKTVESVLTQNRKLYEYIVIDGASDDLSCYEKYYDNIDYFISEKDDGIYDAMNKGLKVANGKYIIFMNAGDAFLNGDILEKVSKYINYDIIYGDYMANNELKKNGHSYNVISSICERMVVHQAIFARQECFENNMFDTRYKIVADRKWAYCCLKNRFKFHKIDLPIVEYDLTGVSSNQIEFDIESKQLQEELFGKKIVLFFRLKRVIRKIFK